MDIQVPGVGTLLHSTFFNNTEGDYAGLPAQSFPDPYPFGFHKGYTGAAEAHSLGFAEAWDNRIYKRDAVYRLQYTFAHVWSDLRLVLTGQTAPEGTVQKLQDDEQWGIGAVVVKTD